MQCLTVIETEYEAAKERLQAAQQEKLEAAADFLAIRAALRQALGTLWPGSCPCGTMEYEKDVSAEKDVSGNWV